MMNRQQSNLFSSKNNLRFFPLLGLTLFMGGCSFNFSLGEKNLDVNDVQTKIKDELVKQTKLTVNSVTCPEQIKAKAGNTFECKADTNEGNIQIVANVTDDKGKFTWKTKEVENTNQTSTPEPTNNEQTSQTSTPEPTSGAQTLDTDDIQTQIKDELTKQTQLTVSSVTCPEQIKAEADNTFDCNADTEAGNIPIAAKVKNDKGEFSWNARDLIDLKIVENSIQTGIKQQVQVNVTADCGAPKYKVAKTGDNFKCQIEDKQKNTKDVEVTVKDSEGNVTWKLLK
jgi:hypothetical protein